MFLKTLLIDPILFARILVIVILSVTLHELAHGWAAISQGDNTPIKKGHMTPNPVVHLGWTSIFMLCVAGIAWGQMPVNPAKFRFPKWSNIIVSAAGPLLNLGLGLLFIGLLKLSYSQGLTGILSPAFLYVAARINLMLFLFNLIPIPPLDGFQVFSEFFPYLKPIKDNPFCLFALMFFLVVQEVRDVLFGISDLIIRTINGF